jgi:hypothetical protein
VSWRSKHPLLIGHTCCEPLSEVRLYTELPFVKASMETSLTKGMKQIIQPNNPVIICNRKQSHYSGPKIFKLMTKRDSLQPCIINFCVSCWLNSSQTCSCLLNQIGDIHTINITRKRKSTIAKLIIYCLSYNVVASLPFESILSKKSSYEPNMPDAVMSFISRSSGY